MLWKMVTGNNKENTIIEFKAASFGGLKSSLSTLILHCTRHFLYYGIESEGTFYYLKKLRWEENELDILDKEFDSTHAFKKVLALSFSEEHVLLPASFKNDKAFLFTENLSCTETAPMINEKLYFHTKESYKKAILTKFPEANFQCISQVGVNQNSTNTAYQVFICSNNSNTKITLIQNKLVILKETYSTPDAQSILYFTLNALQVNDIENPQDCTFHIYSEARQTEVSLLFSDYFQNIQEGLPSKNSIEDMSIEDSKPFQFVLNAL